MIFDSDKLKEECGVVGVFRHPEAANLAYLGLYALQHRGQEACGIATIDSKHLLRSHKAFGLVGDAFDENILNDLDGLNAIGHNRYSTHGGRSMQNIQPFTFKTPLGPLAIAHNGNLTNSNELRGELEAQGSIFQSSSDTEIFMHLIARSKSDNLVARIKEAMQQVHGAYSLIIMAQDRIFAVRDPYGFRPLVFGKLLSSYIAASESCALDLIDAKLIREVNPGEIVEMSDEGITSHELEAQKPTPAFCAFEPIYFARPDSEQFGHKMYDIRKRLGAQLADESPTQADVVIAVPDSGVPMAMGYAEQIGLPYEVGLVRNHYVGRTFIEPSQSIRDFGVKLKLNPIRSVLENRRVIVVDDSLVRGTTSKKIIRMLRVAGASEVHVKIASPPITHSCYYGIDTPKRSQLLAAQESQKNICKILGADSLAYLSHEGLSKALQSDNTTNSFCYACFGNSYPEKIFAKISKEPVDKS